ncbi:hypothetical protein DPMN_121620 [Dreissena polymorpha]|uniref:Uncharacterized protein n=1 Tax=Dreissena polymorpha TaxID=45954 RepID=A0A9D4JTQ3_DREPO|nr:hypothetical protein DPMN_121620 [Dreissena polymorpha]
MIWDLLLYVHRPQTIIFNKTTAGHLCIASLVNKEHCHVFKVDPTVVALVELLHLQSFTTGAVSNICVPFLSTTTSSCRPSQHTLAHLSLVCHPPERQKSVTFHSLYFVKTHWLGALDSETFACFTGALTRIGAVHFWIILPSSKSLEALSVEHPSSSTLTLGSESQSLLLS